MEDLDYLRFQNAQMQLKSIDFDKGLTFNDAEFTVFSQWGDDGLIQYLISKLNIKNRTFIEFGVEDYIESNTRFLLMNNNWTGLVFDSSEENVNSIIGSYYYWKYNLTARKQFINAENVNNIISEEGFTGEIGLLHIDVDGNDYWIWKQLDIVKPDIAIIEYNDLLGIEKPITIPYEAEFDRTKKHYSNLYAGASLLSLSILAKEKDYFLVGTNSSANNAYFVSNKFSGQIDEMKIEDYDFESKFRESRDKSGNLTFLNREQSIQQLKGMEFYNILKDQIEIF